MRRSGLDAQDENSAVACRVITRWRCLAALMLGGLMLLAAGCVQQVAVPPPNFAAPVIRPQTMTLAMPNPPVVPVAPATPDASRRPVAGGRVVIDPGHGGRDVGAQAFGIEEKPINLAVARLVARKLNERGINVVLTRKSDVFIELLDRAQAASTYRADLFVSIHADSNPSPDKQGHSILLPRSGNPSASLAGHLIDRRMAAAGSPSHVVRTDDRGLVVLKRTTCPAVLVELGFLSNRAEASRLVSPACQESLAEGIAEGITDYLARK